MKTEHVGPPMASDMTLRDYFAAKAMAARITGEGTDWSSWSDLDTIAQEAYKTADAMLEARK